MIVDVCTTVSLITNTSNGGAVANVLVPVTFDTNNNQRAARVLPLAPLPPSSPPLTWVTTSHMVGAQPHLAPQSTVAGRYHRKTFLICD